MSGQRAIAQIEEGRDGRGSHLAPPESPCECVVQRTVQSDPDCTGDCTAHSAIAPLDRITWSEPEADRARARSRRCSG